MLPRIVSGLVALLLVGAMVTGCSGQPAPEPSTPSAPTFASDEEAFAAAEETYRAYVDAVNARREDPHSTPNPTSFLVGDAFADELGFQRELEESGLSIDGPTQVVRISPTDTSASSSRISILVCLDSSKTRLVDATGGNVTPADRPDQVGAAVSLVLSGTRLLIERSESAQEQVC